MIDQSIATERYSATVPDPDRMDYERRISSANTFDYWIKAHRWNTPWHQRFGRGYCHRCQERTNA